MDVHYHSLITCYFHDFKFLDYKQSVPIILASVDILARVIATHYIEYTYTQHSCSCIWSKPYKNKLVAYNDKTFHACEQLTKIQRKTHGSEIYSNKGCIVHVNEHLPIPSLLYGANTPNVMIYNFPTLTSLCSTRQAIDPTQMSP